MSGTLAAGNENFGGELAVSSSGGPSAYWHSWSPVPTTSSSTGSDHLHHHSAGTSETAVLEAGSEVEIDPSRQLLPASE